jgi:hypothetical protein
MYTYVYTPREGQIITVGTYIIYAHGLGKNKYMLRNTIVYYANDFRFSKGTGSIIEQMLVFILPKVEAITILNTRDRSFCPVIELITGQDRPVRYCF